MRVAVGSTNPVKVEGVRRAFRLLGCVEVLPVHVETSVGPQPITLRDTIRGAVERAVKALSSIREADYSVGVEAGLFQLPPTLTGYLEVQVAAIADLEKGVTLGFSPGFEFPLRVVEAVTGGKVVEAEEAMEELSGIRGIGEREGAIGFLTRGYIDRTKLSELAVVAALIPRLNPSLYPKARRIEEVLESLNSLDI